MIEIPLNSKPEQLFSISIAGTRYDIRVIINSRTGIWTIGFSTGGVDLATGIPLLGGSDILGYLNLPIRRAYVVNLDNPSGNPTRTGLGTSSRLFLLTEKEVSGVSPV